MTTDGRAPRLRVGSAAGARGLARVPCAAALEGYRGIFPTDAQRPTPTTFEPSWTRLLIDRDATVRVAEAADDLIGTVVVRVDHGVPSGWLLVPDTQLVHHAGVAEVLYERAARDEPRVDGQIAFTGLWAVAGREGSQPPGASPCRVARAVATRRRW